MGNQKPEIRDLDPLSVETASIISPSLELASAADEAERTRLRRRIMVVVPQAALADSLFMAGDIWLWCGLSAILIVPFGWSIVSMGAALCRELRRSRSSFDVGTLSYNLLFPPVATAMLLINVVACLYLALLELAAPTVRAATCVIVNLFPRLRQGCSKDLS